MSEVYLTHHSRLPCGKALNGNALNGQCLVTETDQAGGLIPLNVVCVNDRGECNRQSPVSTRVADAAATCAPPSPATCPSGAFVGARWADRRSHLRRM